MGNRAWDAGRTGDGVSSGRVRDWERSVGSAVRRHWVGRRVRRRREAVGSHTGCVQRRRRGLRSDRPSAVTRARSVHIHIANDIKSHSKRWEDRAS